MQTAMIEATCFQNCPTPRPMQSMHVPLFMYRIATQFCTSYFRCTENKLQKIQAVGIYTLRHPMLPKQRQFT